MAPATPTSKEGQALEWKRFPAGGWLERVGAPRRTVPAWQTALPTRDNHAS